MDSLDVLDVCELVTPLANATEGDGVGARVEGGGRRDGVPLPKNVAAVAMLESLQKAKAVCVFVSLVVQ